MNYCRALARIIASRRALLFGDFILSSGIKSKYYLDLRKLLGDPESFKTTIDILAQKALEYYGSFDVVVGVATAGIPWASGLALKLGKGLAYVRSEVKGHGVETLVEGLPFHGDCIVVDDVATTGASIERVVLAVKPYCNVKGALVLVDRLQGARERLERINIRLSYVVDIRGLVECLREENIGVPDNVLS
ncbi:MAG: orotate phosphoribosyltransferase [Acidilobaceae archaeon]